MMKALFQRNTPLWSVPLCACSFVSGLPHFATCCHSVCHSLFLAVPAIRMYPVAVTAGNTFVLKPSEKDPGASMMLADLALQAGLPK